MNLNKPKLKIIIILVTLLAATYLLFAITSAYRFFGFYNDPEKEAALEKDVKEYLMVQGFSEADITEINAFWNEKVVKHEAYVVFASDKDKKYYFYEHDGVISTDCNFSEKYFNKPCN